MSIAARSRGMQRPLRFFVLECGLLLLSTGAHAEPLTSSDTRPAALAPASDFRFSAGPGAFWGDTLDGVMVSLLATYRIGPIEAGPTVEGGTQVFGGEYGMLGVTAGPVWRHPSGLRLELLGVFGQDRYSGVGCGLFCDRGGASASMAYAAARGGVSYAFGSTRRRHFELGAAGFYGSDLERRTVDYTTVSKFVFDFNGPGEPSVSTQRDTLGGVRGGAMITFGVIVDG
jgi:hypothetical protein